MLPWNVEMVIWIDDALGIEVLGVAAGKTNFAHRLTTADWAEAKAFARAAGFPGHHLVARPEHEDDPRIHKGIADWTSLKEAFHWARGEAANGRAFLETDMRAHANPTRMENIRVAAEDLASKLSSLCPACGAPGFWTIERVAGLPCADCGAPTCETHAQVYGCLKCVHRVTRERTDLQYADPGRCDYCNP
jgi:DNA-directed RNA polymerase subunit RPC12/RpoP